MKKRALALLTALTLLFAVSAARICRLSANAGDRRAAAGQSGLQLTLARPRGTLYDADLTPLTNAQRIYLASVAPTAQAVAEITRRLAPEPAAQALDRLRAGKPIVLEVPADFSAEGALVFETYARYSERQPAPHAVGYLDAQGRGASGAERAFDAQLSRAPVTVTYTVDARGRVLPGVSPRVEGYAPQDRSGVALTLDSAAQKIVEDVVRAHLEAGAALVLDPSTGKIRAMCSVPDFSPLDLAASLHADSAPLVDRAASAYNVGSVFKLCVAAAALEQGVSPDFTAACTGVVRVRDVAFHCHAAQGHGALDLPAALAQSCNAYFIALGLAAGGDALLRMSESLGFGESLTLAPGLRTDSGVLPEAWELREQPASLANFSFGQGRLMLTPLHVAAMVCAIVDGGLWRAPTLFEGTVDSSGALSRAEPAEPRRVMSAETAAALRDFMVGVVEEGTGSAARAEPGGAGGKTATAETGWVRDGRAVNQTWFAGFYPARQPRFVIVVLGEDGVSGSQTAAPVFREIAQRLAALPDF